MIPQHNFKEKRILFIMEDFGCNRDAAERIHDDIMERTDEFGDLARQYIITGGNRK